MKKSILILLAAILFSGGCKTVAKPVPIALVTQQPEPDKQSYDITVAVVPFTEKRLNTNRYGSAYRYLVPLALYGTIRYERPEEARMFNCPEEARMFVSPSEPKFNMSEDLAKAVASGLGQKRMFFKVEYTSDPEKLGADLILSADINSTLYEGKTYSYGISFLGPVLWCFGLPAGSSYNRLSLTFYLNKRDTKELIWSYVLDKEKSVIQGLYYNRGENVNNYVSLLNEGIEKIAKDLKRKLSKIPPDKLKVIIPELSVQQEAQLSGPGSGQPQESKASLNQQSHTQSTPAKEVLPKAKEIAPLEEETKTKQ